MDEDKINQAKLRMKEAKRLANKKYQEKLKEKIRLAESKVKNPLEHDNNDDFFFRQKMSSETKNTSIQTPLVQPQQNAMYHQQQTSLKTKVLEALALSMISIIPGAIRCILTQLSKPSQQSSKESKQEEQPTFIPQSLDTNGYYF